MKRVTIASTITTLLSICFIIIILSEKNCDECFSMPVMMVKFLTCGFVILIGSIYFKWLYLKSEQSIFTIETLPLLETNEAAPDVPFSCEATIEYDKETVLTSPYSGLPCVYYHSITEQLTGSGKHSKWKVTENLINLSPFYIVDSRGKLKIDPKNLDSDFSGFRTQIKDHTVPDPENSEIDCTPVMVKQLIQNGTKVFGISLKSSNLRKSEYILPPLVKVFVSGFLSKKDGELVLLEHQKYPLIISQKSKDAYIDSFYKGKGLIFMVHVLVALGFTIIVLSSNYFLHIQPLHILYTLIVGNYIICMSILLTIYNRLITLTHRAQFSLTEINNELKRRSELIPKIVELVSAYAGYEKETQMLIALTRAQTQFQKTVPVGKNIAATTILSLNEAYPTLHASDGYKQLMMSLIDTEERIAYARAFYNRNVRKLNTLIKQFPFIIIAKVFEIGEMTYVTIGADPSSSK